MSVQENFVLLKDGLAAKGVTVSRTPQGKLRYSGLREAELFFMPVLKHYKHELLAELGGPPVTGADTYARFMSLPLVRCLRCAHYVKGRMGQGDCSVRGRRMLHPARRIRCIWFRGGSHE